MHNVWVKRRQTAQQFYVRWRAAGPERTWTICYVESQCDSSCCFDKHLPKFSPKAWYSKPLIILPSSIQQLSFSLTIFFKHAICASISFSVAPGFQHKSDVNRWNKFLRALLSNSRDSISMKHWSLVNSFCCKNDCWSQRCWSFWVASSLVELHTPNTGMKSDVITITEICRTEHITF